MSISVEDAYNSTYCYEQMLQGNNSVSCNTEEMQNSSQNIENQELNQLYNEEVGGNVDVEA